MSYVSPLYQPYSYASPYLSHSAVRSQVWSEYVPVETKYIDYEPQHRVDYVPVEKSFTDYVEVRHETDYVPVSRVEKRTEYVPVDRYETKTDYVPVERSRVVNHTGSYLRNHSPYYSSAYNDALSRSYLRTYSPSRISRFAYL